MKKLIKGLLDFQRHGFPAYRETFAKLAHGQSPDTLFISCSDSRVVPNLFASTHPGDLFVARNVGNMVPPSDSEGVSIGDTSEASALEYALLVLQVPDIIVCGHSGCGAMGAIHSGQGPSGAKNLTRWLELGRPTMARFEAGELPSDTLKAADRLSQLNVLQQLHNLMTYPLVRERVERGALRLHGWWFDIAAARVHAYRQDIQRFVPIDEEEGNRLINELNTPAPATAFAAPPSAPATAVAAAPAAN